MDDNQVDLARDRDALAGARGILFGAIFGVAIWAMLFLVVAKCAWGSDPCNVRVSVFSDTSAISLSAIAG